MGGAKHGHIVGSQEIGHRHQRPHTATAEDVGALASLEARVDGDEDSAGLGETQCRHHPLRTVEGPHGDPVARLDPRGHERPGERAGRGEELGEGESGRAVLDGRSVAEPFGGPGGDSRDRQFPPTDAVTHRVTVSATFINPARLPPMILRTASSSRPSSWST